MPLIVINFILSHIFLLLSLLFIPHVTYNTNAGGSDVCRWSSSLWIRTLDRNTLLGLPECMVSKICATARDKTGPSTKDALSPRIEIKIYDWATSLKDRDSTDHATATDIFLSLVCMYVCMYVCIFEVLGRVNISGHWRT